MRILYDCGQLGGWSPHSCWLLTVLTLNASLQPQLFFQPGLVSTLPCPKPSVHFCQCPSFNLSGKPENYIGLIAFHILSPAPMGFSQNMCPEIVLLTLWAVTSLVCATIPSRLLQSCSLHLFSSLCSSLSLAIFPLQETYHAVLN